MGGIDLTGIGSVPGSPTDEFALDEFDGMTPANRHFRSPRRSPGARGRLPISTFSKITPGLLAPVGSSPDIARGGISGRHYHDIAVA